MRTVLSSRLTRAAVLGAVVALAACEKDPELVLAPQPAASANAAFFERYVAIGNSITAGYQSGGLGEATQRAAYPALIARALGLSYSAPYVQGGGCGPLSDAISAFRAASGDNSVRTSAVCVRTSGSINTFFNNVAVPGANSATPTNTALNGVVGGNPLTTFILGGQTQVQRAVEYDATFLSIWIGNNDVLSAALQGDTTRATPLATFQANYDAMLNGLANTTAVKQKHGVLIGVVDVTNVPAAFTVQAIVQNIGGFRTAVEQLLLGGGRTLQVVTSTCPNTSTALVSLGYALTLAQQVQAGAIPPNTAIPFACSPTTVPGFGAIGAAGIVDPAEIAQLSGRVAAYNAFIAQRANALGFAYYDPNTTLARLKTNPAVIAPIPNITSPTAPFGTAISLDGIHPSNSAHLEIATELVRVINTKYGSNIPTPTIGPIP